MLVMGVSHETYRFEGALGHKPTAVLHYGAHVLDVLDEVPDGSVQMILCSPPYYMLREYGDSEAVSWGDWDGPLGWEPHPDMFVAHLVRIFDALRVKLRDDGCMFVNLNDSMSGSGGYSSKAPSNQRDALEARGFGGHSKGTSSKNRPLFPDIPKKNHFLIPERFVLAMQRSGWFVRDKIVWHKPSVMPQSYTDRTTGNWEPIYLFGNRADYFFDLESVDLRGSVPDGRGPRRRSVWSITMAGTPRTAHVAPWPILLAERMIKMGSSLKGCCGACGAPWSRMGGASWEAGCSCPWVPMGRCTVLDPFCGSAISGAAALSLGQHFIGIDIEVGHLAMARRTLGDHRGDFFQEGVFDESPVDDRDLADLPPSGGGDVLKMFGVDGTS